MRYDEQGDGLPNQVMCGCIGLQVAACGLSDNLVFLYYPGDLIVPDVLQSPQDGNWIALTTSTLRPCRFVVGAGCSDAIADRGAAVPSVDVCDVSLACGQQLRRMALHTLMISRLSGEQRMASLLLEFAYRFGKRGPSGANLTFDLPLSRSEMASYLALNPDTLSRIVTALKSRNLIMMPARSRAVVPDLEALAAQTPLARQIAALHREAHEAGGGAAIGSEQVSDYVS